MHSSHKIILGATSAMALLAAPALAGDTYENSSGGTFRYYGQINPGYLSFDDGVATTSELVDNDNSNTRVGFWIKQPLNNGAEFRFNFESALGLRGSSAIARNVEADALHWRRTEIRKVDFSIKTNSGTFYAGQGSMASDGVAQIDKSGTGLVTYNGIGDTAGAFRMTATDGSLSDFTIGGAFASYDGGRRGRIRYDTPNFNGFTLSMAYGTEILAENVDTDFYDVALRYDRDFGNIDFSGGISVGWTEFESGDDRRDVIASASFLHTSGFNGTIAMGDRDTRGQYGYIKAGYKGDFFSIGSTAVSIDYYKGDDTISTDSEANSYGIGLVQNIDSANLEAYLGYRNYDVSDTSGLDYNDASSILFGARWKF